MKPVRVCKQYGMIAPMNIPGQSPVWTLPTFRLLDIVEVMMRTQCRNIRNTGTVVWDAEVEI